MIETLRNRDDLVAHYTLIGLILIIVFGLLQQSAILHGVFLSAAIFSFHNYIQKSIETIFEESLDKIETKFDGVNLERTTVAIVDMLIAVPMFGLGTYSAKYVNIFVLGIAIILLYSVQYKIYNDVISDIKEITPRRLVFTTLLVLSVLYLLIFEPQLTSISFYREVVFTQGSNGTDSITTSILMSANHVLPTMLSMIILLTGVLIIVLYMSLIATIIGIILTPILIIFDLISSGPNISTPMKIWIITSIVAVTVIVTYYRKVAKNRILL